MATVCSVQCIAVGGRLHIVGGTGPTSFSLVYYSAILYTAENKTIFAHGLKLMSAFCILLRRMTDITLYFLH